MHRVFMLIFPLTLDLPKQGRTKRDHIGDIDVGKMSFEFGIYLT
jgi:hypothetical protein